jgi:NAD(P)-dependent dehydrogenase (short-subunit alcohol dehydrogenase family)
VAFIYHSRDAEAEATAAQIRALGRVALALKADLADAAAVGAAIDRAAAEFGGSMSSCKRLARWGTGARPPSFPSMIGTATWRSTCRGLLRHSREPAALRKAGDGAIVAISSIAAQMCQARNVQAPPPRRSGGDGARRRAGEGRRGIRANAVAVGLTDTDMARTAFAEWGAESAERVVRGIPLRRIGTPEEVARVVCFLAGPDPPTSPARCCRSMAGRSSRRECPSNEEQPDMASAVLARRGLWRSQRV